MQYKQPRRIGLEILRSPDLSVSVLIAVSRLLLKRESLPKLGPYRKRSPEQTLWRLASNSQLGGEARWTALKRLLRMRVTTVGDAFAAPGKGNGTTDDRSVRRQRSRCCAVLETERSNKNVSERLL